MTTYFLKCNGYFYFYRGLEGSHSRPKSNYWVVCINDPEIKFEIEEPSKIDKLNGVSTQKAHITVKWSAQKEANVIDGKIQSFSKAWKEVPTFQSSLFLAIEINKDGTYTVNPVRDAFFMEKFPYSCSDITSAP
jgi:hypothetical protein